MISSTVAEELLAYGRELEESGAAQVGGSFSGSAEADALLASSANAFLLGVLFTQGIPAERAWAGPYELQVRLGTLDLGYLAENPEAVRAGLSATADASPFQGDAASVDLLGGAKAD